MNFFAPLRVRVQRAVIVRIHRYLNGKGKINVQVNQEVTPSDIIGTAEQSSGFRIISLAQALSVSPTEVEKYLKRNIGQKIYKGELLAYKKSWLTGKKIVISPADSFLDFLNPKSGELRLTFLPKKADLPAGVYGIVEMVDQQKGKVVIRTQASIVHGILGSGKMRDGILRVVTKRDGLLGKNVISPDLKGQILVGGSLVFKDSLATAISAGVSGLITGGINAQDYKAIAGGRLVFPKKLENDIGISVLVTEGFGSIAIAEEIDEILQEFDDKFVAIDGNAAALYLPSFESSSLKMVRKTQLPPLQTDFNNDKEVNGSAELTIGQTVRIVGNTYLGNTGKIVAVDQQETLLPAGIRTYLALIETKHKKIKVPVANLEVIL